MSSPPSSKYVGMAYLFRYFPYPRALFLRACILPRKRTYLGMSSESADKAIDKLAPYNAITVA